MKPVEFANRALSARFDDKLIVDPEWDQQKIDGFYWEIIPTFRYRVGREWIETDYGCRWRRQQPGAE